MYITLLKKLKNIKLKSHIFCGNQSNRFGILKQGKLWLKSRVFSEVFINQEKDQRIMLNRHCCYLEQHWRNILKKRRLCQGLVMLWKMLDD